MRYFAEVHEGRRCVASFELQKPQCRSATGLAKAEVVEIIIGGMEDAEHETDVVFGRGAGWWADALGK